MDARERPASAPVRPGGEWAGRRVAVVGFGVSNAAAARFLLAHGARIEVFDRKEAAALGDAPARLAAAAGPAGIEGWHLGPGYLEALVASARREPFAVLLPTPGMRKDLPELAECRRLGASLESEVGLFLRYCPALTVGVTGSAGKTTTTTLLGLMLEETGRQVWVGGNIGRPLLEAVEEMDQEDLVVLELSSFQLQMLRRSPRVAVLLNIRPNHLDVHSSYDEYAAAKRNIVRFQGPEDVAVLNADDPEAAATAGLAPGLVLWFSLRGADGATRGTTPVGTGAGTSVAGAFREGSAAWWLPPGGTERVRAGEVTALRLRGEHNVANALAALAAACALGAPPEAAWRRACAFTGVPHRLELVRTVGGVAFVNDSIATTPDRTEAALASFAEPIVLIAGGYDKKIPFHGLGEAIVRRGLRALVLLGATREKIRRAVEEAAARLGAPVPPVVEARDLAEAVGLAAERARPGDVVLLSPACASYDMFANYEERGRRFRELVAAL